MKKSDIEVTGGLAGADGRPSEPCLVEFDDIEAFRESLHGWDTEPFQLHTGALRITSHFLHVDRLSVMRLGVNRAISDTSAQETGVIAFVVVLGRKRFCGLDVPPGSLVVLGPGRDYRSVLDPGWKSIEFGVSTQLLDEAGLPWADARASQLSPESSVFPLPTRVVAQVDRWADRALRHRVAVGEGGDELNSRATTEELREEVAGFVLPSLLRYTPMASGGGASGGPDRRTSFELTDRAIRLGMSCGSERTSMAALAANLGVSRRTMELAFRSVVGCPPSHYFRTRRLMSVRRDLLRGRSVTEAAFAQGFVSLSRFSAQYQRQFGERPSETRSRAL